MTVIMDMFQVRMIRAALMCDLLMHIKQPAYHEWTNKYIINSIYKLLIQDKKIYSLIDVIAYNYKLTLIRLLNVCILFENGLQRVKN